jgi:hypothetical protein
MFVKGKLRRLGRRVDTVLRDRPDEGFLVGPGQHFNFVRREAIKHALGGF